MLRFDALEPWHAASAQFWVRMGMTSVRSFGVGPDEPEEEEDGADDALEHAHINPKAMGKNQRMRSVYRDRLADVLGDVGVDPVIGDPEAIEVVLLQDAHSEG